MVCRATSSGRPLFRSWLCGCYEPNIDGRCAISSLVQSIKKKVTPSRFLNSFQCKLLLDLLLWIVQEVQRVNPVEDNQLLVDWQSNLVERAEHLVDNCAQASWERQETYPRLILQSSSIFQFEPLIHELLLCATIISARRQLKSGFEAIEVFEKFVDDEKEATWLPKLIDAREKDEKILQRKVAEKVAEKRDQSPVPQYLLRRLSKEFCPFEAVPSNEGDVNGDSSRSTMYLDEADVPLEPLVRIGQGSFGKIYKVLWRGIFCARKVFIGVDNASFETEVQALSTLCHPNIVQFIGCLTSAGESSLVMELMEADLTDLLRLIKRKLDISEVVDVTLQIAEGMRYLHDKRIVHRDLKASNVLVSSLKKNGDLKTGGWIVKLTDFGLARTKFASKESMNSRKHVGTTLWMAPELFKISSKGGREEEPGHFPKKTDVFSFGITCFEILTSELPYAGCKSMKILCQEILSGKRPLLPEGCPQILRDLICRCWDSRPDVRPEFSEICGTLKRLKATLFAGPCTTEDSSRLTCGLLPRDPQRKILKEKLDATSAVVSKSQCDDPSSRRSSRSLSKTMSRENSRDVTFWPKLRQLVTYESSLREFRRLLNVFSQYVHESPEFLWKFRDLIDELAGTEYCQRCIAMYKEARIAYCKREWQRKSHLKKQYGNYLQVSTVDSMKEIPWEELQSMIDSWARDLDDVVKVLYGNERRYAMEIFGEPVSIAYFVDIAKPEFQKFMRFGSNFLKIEPSFERIFPLLDMFASLEKSGPMICHLFAGPPCEEILSQYLDLLSKVAHAAANDFWELEVRMESEQKKCPLYGGEIWKVCSYVVNFLKYLFEVHQKTLEKVLRFVQGLRDEEEMPEEKNLIQGLTQILQNLQRLVKAHAEELQNKNSLLGDTFLENNLHYIYSRVRDCVLWEFVDLEQFFDPSVVGMVIVL